MSDEGDRDTKSFVSLPLYLYDLTYPVEDSTFRCIIDMAQIVGNQLKFPHILLGLRKCIAYIRTMNPEISAKMNNDINAVDLAIHSEEDTDLGNPFLKDLVFKNKPELKKLANPTTPIHIINDKKKVIGVGTTVYADEYMSDKTPFLKMFDLAIIDKLRKPGVSLFVFIGVVALKYNSDVVHFTISEYSKHTGNSKRSAYEGITDLINNKIIAKKPNYTNTYYINPSVLYKGERKYLTY